MTDETNQNAAQDTQPSTQAPAAPQRTLESRVAELERVLHAVTAQLVGHGSTENHGRLYQWYEAVKERLGL